MRKKQSGIIMFLFLLFVLFNPFSAGITHSKAAVLKDSRLCTVSGCTNEACAGYVLCTGHKCAKKDCPYERTANSVYCQNHKPTRNHSSANASSVSASSVSASSVSASSTGGSYHLYPTKKKTKSTSNYYIKHSSSGSKKQSSDAYGSNSYSNAEDFADEWEDDFDDWEDAYDYWESNN